MLNKIIGNPAINFCLLLLIIIGGREYVFHEMIGSNLLGYIPHKTVGILANIILICVSIYYIKKHELLNLSGLRLGQTTKAYLLLPMLYLILLNFITLDALNFQMLAENIVILTLYVISVGIAEEISIRGFLQSYLIKIFGNGRKAIILSVLIASLFFGIIHLINFNKGLYGEMAQILYATFIGVAFGFLLVIVKNLYLIMALHTMINFVGALDRAGIPIVANINNPTSLDNAILIVLLTLPCMLYGLFLMFKYKPSLS